MYDFKLTEEIARWAFEVACKNNPEWYIAFTNPTAGPWKAITAANKKGITGRVYTFDSKEKRPDLILINDSLDLILILEAKSDLESLLLENQIQKSVQVVADVGKMLQKQRQNPYWGKRYMRKIGTVLLWGCTKEIEEETYEQLFTAYYDQINHYSNIDQRMIVGIEVKKEGHRLNCKVCGRNYEKGEKTLTIQKLAQSLNLAYKE